MVNSKPAWATVPPMLKPMPLSRQDGGTPRSTSFWAVPTMAPSMALVFWQMLTVSPTWSAWSWVTSTTSTGPMLPAVTPEAGVRKGSTTTCVSPQLILKAEWPYQRI